MDRAQLADFLRTRREALQPEDVGLVRGSRRRTGGLRREEVAALADMSADYYSRIEQQRGPMPSAQMLTAIARVLQLSLSERDHLFRLGGQPVPRRERDDSISPIMRRIVESLSDVPAIVMTDLGETLLQTPPAVALLGDYTRFRGFSRFLVYRWFTDPAQRALYPVEDHRRRGRVFTADLRVEYAADPDGTPGDLVAALLEASPEFADIWRSHEVDVIHHRDLKRYRHAELGDLELYAQPLLDVDQDQYLRVYTAVPGSPSDEKLKLLSARAASR
ncbi:helix-turn-helix transcriptional regulator [Actinoplanes sp. M2I2]|uniref:helix-turn-helix transcriptional regulator n=1 Tax=Actinoplanes sp. M2I2 TaxID=1734444 RepID=UPI0020221DC5|nr:helix-turn-helix transcriptional regulator [Actinoplanes sp. M2I2]